MMVLLRTKSSRALLVGGSFGTALVAYRYKQITHRPLPSTPTLYAFENNSHENRQRVIVIGAGVVGVSTACKLALKGHSVAVLEPHPKGPGAECTSCAAGGMQRANVVVDRDSWMAVLQCLLAPSGGFRFFNINWFATLSDPFFLRWVSTFTKTSLFPSNRHEEKKQEMLKFTEFAVGDMVQMMEKDKTMAVASGYNSRGCLSVSYEETAALPRHQSHPSDKRSYEPSRRLVGEEILREEPSLRFQAQQPASAKYEYEAKSASAERFTRELARRCESNPALDVTFLYDTRVKAITVKEEHDKQKPRISELWTNRGVIQVPDDVKVVVAAGSWTPHVLALMDLYAPVYPLKGYAMSVNATKVSLKDQDLPSRIVCDKYMFTTRLGEEEIRITSIGEFSGWSSKPTPHVDDGFRREAKRQFPQLTEWIDEAPTRCGHRPFVSDGILLLGAVDTHENLFVSCGPGSNGWKLAMGSGEVIERLVSGQSEEKITQDLGFNVKAFSPAGRIQKTPLFAKLCRVRWDV